MRTTPLATTLVFILSGSRMGARSSAVGGRTALQAGRSRARIPIGSFGFFIGFASSRTIVLGSAQPPTEMSTRDISMEIKAAGS